MDHLCEKCNVTFTRYSGLKRHMKESCRFRPVKGSTTTHTESENENSDDSTSNTMYCSDCGLKVSSTHTHSDITACRNDVNKRCRNWSSELTDVDGNEEYIDVMNLANFTCYTPSEVLTPTLLKNHCNESLEINKKNQQVANREDTNNASSQKTLDLMQSVLTETHNAIRLSKGIVTSTSPQNISAISQKVPSHNQSALQQTNVNGSPSSIKLILKKKHIEEEIRTKKQKSDSFRSDNEVPSTSPIQETDVEKDCRKTTRTITEMLNVYKMPLEDLVSQWNELCNIPIPKCKCSTTKKVIDLLPDSPRIQSTSAIEFYEEEP